MKKHSPLALLLIGFLLLAWHPAPAQGDPARQQGTTVDPAVARRALITGSILPGDQARAPRDEASRAPALIAPPAGGTGPAVKLATPLTYSSNRAGDFDIYRQQEAGGSATALTGPPADQYTPFWSPDGRFLLYTGLRDGNADIYLREAVTGQEQLLTTALTQFYELRETAGLKKKPSTSEVLDWLKLLLAEDLTAEDLKRDGANALPKLHGALLKNEQDVHLFERLAFMARGQR